MRRTLIIGALLLLWGCNGNIVGPFRQRPPKRVDDPLLTISEQERLGRDRLALPDESTLKNENLAPRTYTDRPGPTDR
ncbi:MAG: hypothetical protein NZ700_01785 [Gemmataceae bacterium]|nr:hypothetical protein [Gemmataceae bacterium]MDW8264612.1 hypothetical protein [Gemmataceae bacterium]